MSPTILNHPAAAQDAVRALALPDVLTPRVLADHVGWSEAAVLRALREGRLPGRRLGRRWLISRRALLAWLAEWESGAREEAPHAS